MLGEKMKFELLGNSGTLFPIIYITKNEFKKCYEKDNDEAFYQFNSLLEMYSSHQCFCSSINKTGFTKLYESLGKSKYKGLILSTNVEYDYSVNVLGREEYSLQIALIDKENLCQIPKLS